MAEQYIAQGALWNGGVFAYKLKYVLKRAHELIDFTDYEDLFNKYEPLPKISFDYAVVEKEDNIQVMRFSGEWNDLGTWNTLTEAMEEPVIGKGVLGEQCEGVQIINEMNVPVLAMGLKDVVISASPEGILVSDKESSSYIKPYVDKFEQQMKPIVTTVDRKSPYGFAKAGDVAGVNMTGQGYVNGELKIDMIHPQQIEPEMEGTHTGDYIVLKGTPNVSMAINPEVDGGIGTIAMMVNMIPHVINARPGLKTMLDLPVPRAIMGDMRDMIEK